MRRRFRAWRLLRRHRNVFRPLQTCVLYRTDLQTRHAAKITKLCKPLRTKTGEYEMRMAIAVLLCWLACGTAVLAADCTASGRYDGQSKMPGETFDVSLNLYCADGKLAAQLFTSQGLFDVKGVTVTPERLVIRFDSGASLGTIEMVLTGTELSGSVTIAGETGSVVLVRMADAEAPSQSEPRLDLTPAEWHEDLAALARELPKRHANAFYTLSRESFDAEV